MKSYVLLTCTCALAASIASPSLEASEIPAAITEMLEALGVHKSINDLHSLSVAADCTGPDGPFQTRVDSLLPSSTYFEQSDNERTTRIWSTENRTWHVKEDGTPQDLSSGVRDFVRSHEFHLLVLHNDVRFTNHRPAGESEFAGRPCQLVKMNTADTTEPASICISLSDRLPLYLEMNPQGAEGPVRISFSDWREIDGLSYFFAFTLTEGPERMFTYNYRSITPNAVGDDFFETPTSAEF